MDDYYESQSNEGPIDANDEPQNNIDEDEDKSQSSKSDAEDDLQEINRYWPAPISEIVQLKGSRTRKTVSAFAFNNAGDRFASAGYDFYVKIWDFEALDPELPHPICDNQPCGQTVLTNLDYSKDDQLILVVSGSCQATIIGKDGLVAKQYQCPKGDQYISDMANTKGHVQMLNDGCWSPKDQTNFITCSNDATVRIWDLTKLSQQKTVIKTRSPSTGLRAMPNVCRYSRDSLLIIAGCFDGSILMWDTRRKFISTSSFIKNAHSNGHEISGIDFSYSLNKLCSRGVDESCKIWDIRQLKAPLASKTGLSTIYSETDCSFSPDDSFVITGTSNDGEKPGQLLFLNALNLTTETTIDAADGSSVVRSKWHPKINHIGYSSSDGLVCLTYDRRKSLGGFLCAELASSHRGTKRKKYISKVDYSEISTQKITKIITPHSLPMFREDSVSTSFAKIRQDPKRSYKPSVSAATSLNQGGYVKPAGSTLSSYIARNIAKPVDDGGMNIRERILRHAEEAEQEPLWIKPIQGQQAAIRGGGAAELAGITSAATSASAHAASAQAKETQQPQRQPNSSSERSEGET